jgi:hypothetical protein
MVYELYLIKAIFLNSAECVMPIKFNLHPREDQSPLKHLHQEPIFVWFKLHYLNLHWRVWITIRKARHTEDKTQGLVHARQVPHHCTPSLWSTLLIYNMNDA